MPLMNFKAWFRLLKVVTTSKQIINIQIIPYLSNSIQQDTSSCNCLDVLLLFLVIWEEVALNQAKVLKIEERMILIMIFFLDPVKP